MISERIRLGLKWVVVASLMSGSAWAQSTNSAGAPAFAWRQPWSWSMSSAPAPSEGPGAIPFEPVAPPPAPLAAPSGAIRWREDSLRAYEEARDRMRPLILFLYRSECQSCRGPCRTAALLEREVFGDPRMNLIAAEVVFLRRDLNHLTPDEQRSFEVLGLDEPRPQVAVLDARPGELRLVGQIVGYTEPGAFLVRLSELLHAYVRQAEPGFVRDPRINDPEAAPPPGPSALISGGVLAPEDLAAFLERLGLEPEVERSNEVDPICSMLVSWDGSPLPIRVLFSTNRNYLWPVCPLTQSLDAADPAGASALARLMEENDVIGPMHFAYAQGSRVLTLNLGFENRELTPEKFRAKLESFLEAILRTRPLWDVPNRADSQMANAA